MSSGSKAIICTGGQTDRQTDRQTGRHDQKHYLPAYAGFKNAFIISAWKLLETKKC